MHAPPPPRRRRRRLLSLQLGLQDAHCRGPIAGAAAEPAAASAAALVPRPRGLPLVSGLRVDKLGAQRRDRPLHLRLLGLPLVVEALEELAHLPLLRAQLGAQPRHLRLRRLRPTPAADAELATHALLGRRDGVAERRLVLLLERARSRDSARRVDDASMSAARSRSPPREQPAAPQVAPHAVLLVGRPRAIRAPLRLGASCSASRIASASSRRTRASAARLAASTASALRAPPRRCWPGRGRVLSRLPTRALLRRLHEGRLAEGVGARVGVVGRCVGGAHGVLRRDVVAAGPTA